MPDDSATVWYKTCVCAAGKCFCLYPEDRQLPTEAQPHILESAITPTVLFLKRMEIAGLHHCDFIDRPGGFYVKRQNKHVHVCFYLQNGEFLNARFVFSV